MFEFGLCMLLRVLQLVCIGLVSSCGEVVSCAYTSGFGWLMVLLRGLLIDFAWVVAG